MWVRKIAQLVEYLPGKQEDLSLIPWSVCVVEDNFSITTMSPETGPSIGLKFTK